MKAGYYWSISPGHRESKVCFDSRGLFTKWAKVEVLTNIRDVDIKKFVWKNIVTRFEVP